MKKLGFIIIAVAMSVVSCADSNSKSAEREPQEQGKTIATQNNTNETRTLVAYFSASGVTKQVANLIAEVADADIYEILPEQQYTDADLDWRDSNSRSSIEMRDKSSRPAIMKTDLNINEYNVIYLGFPIWWYTCPTIINTFMETYDFSGKIVIPFATSGGSTIDQACNDLKTAYPKVNWREGRLLNNAGKQELTEWVNAQ